MLRRLLALLALLGLYPGSGSSPLLAQQPGNDAFADRTPLVEDTGVVAAASTRATREPDEGDHAGGGGSSIWWAWLAPAGGFVRFDTHGSNFDTLLAVYRGPTLETLVEVAANDDAGAGTTSELGFRAEPGVEYQIAVDGFAGASGSVVLRWTLIRPVECPAPRPPAGPFPHAGAPEQPLALTLSWDRVGRRFDVIYGADDRVETFELEDPEWIEASESVVALVRRETLTRDAEGNWHASPPSFGERYDLCPGEPFLAQPSLADCSGFLVASDLVATAGHCARTASEARGLVAVFGYRMLDDETPVLAFTDRQVVGVLELVAAHETPDGADWAILRLDRAVSDRSPLAIRREGRAADGVRLGTIGHPGGLPQKADRGGRLRDNSPLPHFVATLDTYVGSSGSPVLDVSSLRVEGLLARGERDFLPRGDCNTSFRCSDDGCRGESVVRSSEFAYLVPEGRTRVFELRFGPCGEPATSIETTASEWTVSGLRPDTEYCWQVTAVECGGVATSPEWRFRTRGAVRFVRGDTDADGTITITDAVGTLRHLFAGAAIDCEKSADADDSGSLRLTDAVYTLAYLFRGGSAPDAPFPGCGFDPSPDALGCSSECARP